MAAPAASGVQIADAAERGAQTAASGVWSICSCVGRYTKQCCNTFGSWCVALSPARRRAPTLFSPRLSLGVPPVASPRRRLPRSPAAAAVPSVSVSPPPAA